MLALNSTNAGKEAIKNAIQINEDGSVTIKFVCVNASYTISADEIKKHDTDNNAADAYSNGDNDMLVLELATEKLMADIKNGKINLGVLSKYEGFSGNGNIDGGYAQQMIYFLTGALADTTVAHDIKTGLSSTQIENVMNDAVKSNKNAITFALYEGSHTAKTTSGENFTIDLKQGHAYAITKYDDETVTFIDPMNSGKKYTMTLEEFSKLGIGMMSVSVTDVTGETTKQLLQNNPAKLIENITGTKIENPEEFNDVCKEIQSLISDELNELQSSLTAFMQKNNINNATLTEFVNTLLNSHEQFSFDIINKNFANFYGIDLEEDVISQFITANIYSKLLESFSGSTSEANQQEFLNNNTKNLKELFETTNFDNLNTQTYGNGDGGDGEKIGIGYNTSIPSFVVDILGVINTAASCVPGAGGTVNAIYTVLDTVPSILVSWGETQNSLKGLSEAEKQAKIKSFWINASITLGIAVADIALGFLPGSKIWGKIAKKHICNGVKKLMESYLPKIVMGAGFGADHVGVEITVDPPSEDISDRNSNIGKNHDNYNNNSNIGNNGYNEQNSSNNNQNYNSDSNYNSNSSQNTQSNGQNNNINSNNNFSDSQSDISSQTKPGQGMTTSSQSDNGINDNKNSQNVSITGHIDGERKWVYGKGDTDYGHTEIVYPSEETLNDLVNSLQTKYGYDKNIKINVNNDGSIDWKVESNNHNITPASNEQIHTPWENVIENNLNEILNQTTLYDKDGYDKDGYNKAGYDRNGNNKDGTYNPNFNTNLTDEQRNVVNNFHNGGYNTDNGFDNQSFYRDMVNVGFGKDMGYLSGTDAQNAWANYLQTGDFNAFFDAAHNSGSGSSGSPSLDTMETNSWFNNNFDVFSVGGGGSGTGVGGGGAGDTYGRSQELWEEEQNKWMQDRQNRMRKYVMSDVSVM